MAAIRIFVVSGYFDCYCFVPVVRFFEDFVQGLKRTLGIGYTSLNGVVANQDTPGRLCGFVAHMD